MKELVIQPVSDLLNEKLLIFQIKLFYGGAKAISTFRGGNFVEIKSSSRL